ncbi:hypothetical protein FQN60_003493, partial [Etheostoma spectabile]
MDHITFHHDTVLSDVHMLLPNARHLMTRLTAVGQPVFISKFKILSDGEKHGSDVPGRSSKEAEGYEQPREDGDQDTKGPQGTAGEDGEEEEEGEDGREGKVEAFLDEDGDLDITHRPRKTPKEPSGRDLVCPIILQQSNPVLEEEEDNTEDEADRSFDIIKIDAGRNFHSELCHTER